MTGLVTHCKSTQRKLFDWSAFHLVGNGATHSALYERLRKLPAPVSVGGGLLGSCIAAGRAACPPGCEHVLCQMLYAMETRVYANVFQGSASVGYHRCSGFSALLVDKSPDFVFGGGALTNNKLILDAKPSPLSVQCICVTDAINFCDIYPDV